MEESEAVSFGLSALRQAVSEFFSLLQKAPDEGASAEFTRDFNDALMEMQQAVIDARELVLSAQERERVLSARNDELEREIARRDEWAEVKLRYRLVDLGGRRGMAYALREEFVGDEEPQHYLCTTCFEDGKKGFLRHSGMSIKPYTCQRCER